MATPTRYEMAYDFTNFQSLNPTTPLPADKLEIEFNALQTTTDEIINNLNIIQRSDGALANNSVGADQLKSEVTIGVNAATNWQTGIEYEMNDTVYQNNNVYRAFIAHTAGIFATDLAANKWTLILDFDQFLDAAEGDLVLVEADLAAVEADLASVESDLSAVEADAAAVEADVGAVETDLLATEADLSAVEADAAAVEADLAAVNGAIAAYAQPLDAELTTLAGLSSVANLTALAGLTGAANKIPYFTGPGAVALADAISSTSTKGLSYLPSLITISNNGSDANNDIDFSAGIFQVSDGSNQGLATAETKRLDATWASGTNAGGLASGLTKSNSTWYHCFKLFNPTTGATGSGFDISITATNLLSDSAVIAAGFTKYKRIASILTDGSGNIRNGKFLFGKGFYYFEFNSPLLDINVTNQGTSAVSYTLSTPLGVKATAFMNISAVRGGTGTSMYFSDPDNTDLAPSTSSAPLAQLFMGTNDVDRGQTLEIVTNTSSQIRTRWSNSDSSTTMKITVTKFLDITN